MRFTYRVYGLSLDSDRSIPGLQVSAATGASQHAVHFLDSRDLPPDAGLHVLHASDARDDHGHPIVQLRGSRDRLHYEFQYSDGTAFRLHDRGATILARWPDTLTLEDTATYLLGPILGFALRLQGRVCLHASSVAVGGAAVAFTGPSGAGKSTLAAAMVAQGHRMLAEDVSSVRVEAGQCWIDPGPPLIRLWQPSVESLFGSADAMPLLTPNWDKRYQPLSSADGTFMPDPCPVGVVYVLAARQPLETPLRIRSLTPREALMELVSNTYSNHLLDATMRATEFDQLGLLVARVAVRELQVTDDLRLLPQVCEAIHADLTRSSRVAPTVA